MKLNMNQEQVMYDQLKKNDERMAQIERIIELGIEPNTPFDYALKKEWHALNRINTAIHAELHKRIKRAYT